MILEDDEGLFFLGSWQESDEASPVLQADNFTIAYNLTDQFPHPYAPENTKAYIQMVQNEGPRTIFATFAGGQAASGIDIQPRSDIIYKNAEVGYFLSEKYRGRGITSKVIQLIVDNMFQTFDFNKIIARLSDSNKASQRVLEKTDLCRKPGLKKLFLNRERMKMNMPMPFGKIIIHIK